MQWFRHAPLSFWTGVLLVAGALAIILLLVLSVTPGSDSSSGPGGPASGTSGSVDDPQQQAVVDRAMAALGAVPPADASDVEISAWADNLSLLGKELGGQPGVQGVAGQILVDAAAELKVTDDRAAALQNILETGAIVNQVLRNGRFGSDRVSPVYQKYPDLQAAFDPAAVMIASSEKAQSALVDAWISTLQGALAPVQNDTDPAVKASATAAADIVAQLDAMSNSADVIDALRQGDLWQARMDLERQLAIQQGLPVREE